MAHEIPEIERIVQPWYGDMDIPFRPRVFNSNLQWRIDHCHVSINQLKSLRTVSHVYGISDLGRKAIKDRLHFWREELSRTITVSRHSVYLR